MRHRTQTLTLCLALGAVGSLFAQEAKFDTPVRIEADGKFIDTGKQGGYAGPLVKDYDGDGLPDLLVTSFGGSITFFKNVGTRAEPKFAAGTPLQAEGKPIEVDNW